MAVAVAVAVGCGLWCVDVRVDEWGGEYKNRTNAEVPGYGRRPGQSSKCMRKKEAFVSLPTTVLSWMAASTVNERTVQ